MTIRHCSSETIPFEHVITSEIKIRIQIHLVSIKLIVFINFVNIFTNKITNNTKLSIKNKMEDMPHNYVYQKIREEQKGRN